LVILVGAVLGALPYLAFLGSLKFAASYLTGCFCIAVALAVWRVPAGGGQPRVVEYLLALAGWAALLEIVMWYGFAAYGLAYGAMRAIGIVGSWLGVAQLANPSSVAFWVSGPSTAIFSFSALWGVRDVSGTFPTPAINPVSVYDSLLRKGTPWWAVPLLFAASALVIATYFFWPASWWLYLVSSLAIFGAGGQSFDVTFGSRGGVIRRPAIRALQKLYAVLGYRTVISPKAKDSNPDVDLLFKRVDILATRGQDALVIELRAPPTSGAVSAADASFLPVAARAVSRFLSQDLESPIQAQPILVLVDQRPTEDLGRLAKGEGVKVFALTKEAVFEVLGTEDESVLRQLAQRYLPGSSPPLAEESGRSGAASAV
jgi:hypothetical protein